MPLTLGDITARQSYQLFFRLTQAPFWARYPFYQAKIKELELVSEKQLNDAQIDQKTEEIRHMHAIFMTVWDTILENVAFNFSDKSLRSLAIGVASTEHWEHLPVSYENTGKVIREYLQGRSTFCDSYQDGTAISTLCAEFIVKQFLPSDLIPLLKPGAKLTQKAAAALIKKYDLPFLPKLKQAESLLEAVLNGDHATVKQLLRDGADPNVMDNSGASALYHAAYLNQLPIMQTLLKTGANTHDRVHYNGYTPLDIAILSGYGGAVSILLPYHRSIYRDANEKDGNYTPLHYATQRVNRNIVRLLLAYTPDLRARTNGGLTALHLAADLSNPWMAQQLVAAGADVNATIWPSANEEQVLDTWRPQAQARAEFRPMHGDMLRNHLHNLHHNNWAKDRYNHLLCKHSRIRAGDEGTTPLHIAANRNNTTLVLTLLAKQAKTEIRDDNGMTPLQLAVSKGNMLAAVALLKSGRVDTTVTLTDGTPLMHLAAQGENANVIVPALLACGIDPDQVDDSGRNACEAMLLHGNTDKAMLLQRLGVTLSDPAPLAVVRYAATQLVYDYWRPALAQAHRTFYQKIVADAKTNYWERVERFFDQLEGPGHQPIAQSQTSVDLPARER